MVKKLTFILTSDHRIYFFKYSQNWLITKCIVFNRSNYHLCCFGVGVSHKLQIENLDSHLDCIL